MLPKVYYRGFWSSGLPTALLVLAVTVACSRPAGLRGDAKAPAGGSPFNQDAGGNTARTPGANVADPSRVQDQTDARGTPTGVPFKTSSPQGVPAGTLLTVRLQSSLSSARTATDGTFSAVLDAPIIVEDITVVPRGAPVKGRVESARASEAKRNSGYVRLTLDSMNIDGREVPLQTSSLFARGNALEIADPAGPGSGYSKYAGPRTIRLKKGRRLTFRLTMPLELGSVGTEASANSSIPGIE